MFPLAAAGLASSAASASMPTAVSAAAPAAGAGAGGITGLLSAAKTGVDKILGSETGKALTGPAISGIGESIANNAGVGTGDLARKAMKSQYPHATEGQFNAGNLGAGAAGAVAGANATKYASRQSAQATKYAADKNLEASKYKTDVESGRDPTPRYEQMIKKLEQEIKNLSEDQRRIIADTALKAAQEASEIAQKQWIDEKTKADKYENIYRKLVAKFPHERMAVELFGSVNTKDIPGLLGKIAYIVGKDKIRPAPLSVKVDGQTRIKEKKNWNPSAKKVGFGKDGKWSGPGF